MELQGNLLYGELPEEMGEMVQLRFLNMSHQRGVRRFSGILPRRLTLLNKLAELHIQHNQLEGALPERVWRMESLELVNAQHNQLEGPIPHGIGYLRNLRELLLYDNNIDGTVPDTLDGMEFCTRLELYNNRLSGTLPPALGHMPRLQFLDAHNNHLSGSLPNSIGLLDDLEHLLLRRNALRGPLPAEMGNLRSVLVVELSENNLTHGLPAELGNLLTVEQLHLNDNLPGLSGAIPSELGQLANAQSVLLTNNAIDGLLTDFLQSFQVGGRTVGLTGNPYYCPLPEWSIAPLVSVAPGGASNASASSPPPPPLSAYAGVECLHCPDDYENPATRTNLKYTRADGSPDYTRSCSGHGMCVRGEFCECEPAWDGALSGFSDCSHLACPTATVMLPNGEEAQAFCNNRGTCANTEYAIGTFSANGTAVTTTGTCVDGASTFLDPMGFRGEDFVAYYINCEADMVTIAHCDCPPGTSQPECGDIILAAATLTVLSAAPKAASAQTFTTALLATGLAIAAAATQRRTTASR